jgi:predicted nucleic acid-binding protein
MWAMVTISSVSSQTASVMSIEEESTTIRIVLEQLMAVNPFQPSDAM